MARMQEKSGGLTDLLFAFAHHDTMNKEMRIREKRAMDVEQRKMQQVIHAVSAIRCGAADSEEALHHQVCAALTAAGFSPVHEARLAPRCRIDFLVGDLGIEIKKSRPNAAQLKAQLARYAACEQVGALLVIAPRGVNLPKTIGGKPVAQIALERLWGISLP